MRRILAILLVSVLAGCAGARPDTIVSPRLDSGVTSENGGGARALGNQIGGAAVTTRVSPVQ